MQNTTPAILGTHTNADENLNNSNSSKIYDTTEIEGTPFKVIETEHETFLTLGRYKITRANFTKADYIKEVETKSWDLIIDVIGICIEY